MRENVVREFIEMSTAYAKDTAHVRKQFETSAEQTQHLTTLAKKVTTEAAQPLSGVVKTFNNHGRDFGCIWVHGLLHGVNARSAIKVVSDAELWTDLAMLQLASTLLPSNCFCSGALFVC